MGLWAKIFGAKKKPVIQAGFDAARTTEESARQWEFADNLGAEATGNPGVRALLRQRGRYEQLNNPYTDGILQTLAADVIGRAPRLQMQVEDNIICKIIESEFTKWSKKIGLGKKLRLAIESRAASGEVFILMFSNPALPCAVKLDIKLIEADQVTTPVQAMHLLKDTDTDGIEIDEYGNPLYYHILTRHPGEIYYNTGVFPLDYERVPAENVLHLYKIRRPGQRRGIPQITSSLPLFADRRGFRKSIVTAARVVAELGAVLLQTNAFPDANEIDNDGDEIKVAKPFETIKLERGVMTTLPEGYSANQMKPEQPPTTYSEFDDKLINEAARPLSMPFNIAACNSSGYNYASGRLDHQTYDRILEIDQDEVESDILDPLLERWILEALLIEDYLPKRAKRYFGLKEVNEEAVLLQRERFYVPHLWLWKSRPHIDPVKEQNADKIGLSLNSVALSDLLAKRGIDLEDHLQKLQREKEAFVEFGLASKSFTTHDISAAIEIIKAYQMHEITELAAMNLLISLGFNKKVSLSLLQTEKSNSRNGDVYAYAKT